METPENKKSFASLKAIKPRSIHLRPGELVTRTFLQKGRDQPLVIQPVLKSLDLVVWARDNVAWIEQELLRHGAILFRGFTLSSPQDFEAFAAAICQDLFKENGEHVPDSAVANIYTPIFYAPEKKLLWHNENSFNYAWPMKIWFYAARPADSGGETPIADSHRVFQLIDPAIREQFEQKQIMYVRNYGDVFGLDWRVVFNVNTRTELEEIFRATDIAFEWKDNDHLHTHFVRPAIAKHPRTGKMVWWNQATHWHVSCLDQTTRALMRTQFKEEDLPRNCYYGDGSPIADESMQNVIHAFETAEIVFPWQQGDILLLDNMAVAHARNPYQGERKLYVSMGEMLTLDALR